MDEWKTQLVTFDMNADGDITISDLWDWLAQLALMPGDVIIYLMLMHTPAVTGFFELSTADYGGSFSRFLSIATLLVTFIAVTMTYQAIRNADRALTSHIVAGYRELRRMLRIMRRRVVSWYGLMRSRRESSPQLQVAGVELGDLEHSVLRCYASVDEVLVLTPREVAARLRLSPGQVEHALRRLGEFHLVERSFGTDEGEDGHHISQAGQMYLIGG